MTSNSESNTFLHAFAMSMIVLFSIQTDSDAEWFLHCHNEYKTRAFRLSHSRLIASF